MASQDAISPALQAQLDLLREVYAAKLNDKIGEIFASWHEFLAAPAAAQPLAALHRQTHSLVGSGATFGFPEVSQAARRAEEIIKALLDGAAQGEAAPQELKRSEIEAALQELRAAARRGEAQLFTPPSEAEAAARRDETRLIYFFSDEPSGCPSWVQAVETFGYRLEKFAHPAALVAACERESPAALLVDCAGEPLLLEREGESLAGALEQIARRGEKLIPSLWACGQSDLRARLQAVRLGGAAFFAHPVDVDALLVKLDDLTAPAAPDPFRILIVDDEPSLGRLYSVILRQAGMETQVVTDPFAVMEPLVNFRPDLILMDLYMPGCAGTELAAIIRQQEAYIGIPIMFLSVEADISRQHAAMRQGGDDFLLKPVEPQHLVAAVTTRATRSRSLRHLMVRDSLTGLLGHTKIKEQLDIELDRARRLGHCVSLAMIDLDHFKRVNDAYGHATGDRVLRSLARLLAQRLRQTDVIGRYGGEEFAVIMNGTSPKDAQRKLERVRAGFEELSHCWNGQSFQLSFSAGIAASPPFSDATGLCEAAERALSEAKGAGRNQIALAADEMNWLRRTPL
ncbi:MAG TPA: diguanylate cyclase [Abditibacterium sp.]|jgi:diguanylate cyclase (GGDEF)-like protein